MLSKQEIMKAIGQRVTQRKFLEKQLSPEQMKEVHLALGDIIPINSDSPLQWYFTPQFPSGSGIVLAKLKEFTTPKLVKYGFEGEQIVLNLTLKGFSTSWARLPNYLSMVIVGFQANSNEDIVERASRFLYRDANRKPFEEVVFGREEYVDSRIKDIVNAGRMAPSSFNRQPWKFEILSKNEIAVHGWKKIPLIYEEVIAIDLGVVLSHMYLMAKAINSEAQVEAKSERTYLLRF
ncbi:MULTISPECIES: nitroreductase family protein [unclassified Mesotoga]|uniref:nitroreductase family protein n=1 Tax=unclassified Mesotoga TaxID=1184398 RepID=UPI000DA6918C|nr:MULTISPECIES: nitroreductase family protein [unclassified Mesotoga]PZC52229.1 nitroreductase [Mesotoga sp. TolDC]